MTASTMAVPVAAMRALITLIRRSTASTWMELEGELRSAIDALLHIDSAESGVVSSRTRIPLTSGCELFMRYVTRAFLEFPDFDSCKKEVLRRGETFALMSHTSRLKIAELGHSFVQDGTVVLTHGSSRVVTNLLLKASRTKQFSVIVTEGRPDYEGYHVVRILSEAGVPVKLIIDAAVGAMMDKVDLCIVGAEGVMENGGIVNKVGTMQLAVMAKALGKPFYVAAESYKFSRLYPLDQQDLETIAPAQEVEPDLDAAVATGLDNSLAGAAAAAIDTTQPSVDFTPADLITLLFTDLGVLTPAAVSDELIKLYQ